jgi:hypothetical protein
MDLNGFKSNHTNTLLPPTTHLNTKNNTLTSLLIVISPQIPISIGSSSSNYYDPSNIYSPNVKSHKA